MYSFLPIVLLYNGLYFLGEIALYKKYIIILLLCYNYYININNTTVLVSYLLDITHSRLNMYGLLIA